MPIEVHLWTDEIWVKIAHTVFKYVKIYDVTYRIHQKFVKSLCMCEEYFWILFLFLLSLTYAFTKMVT